MRISEHTAKSYLDRVRTKLEETGPLTSWRFTAESSTKAG